MSVLYDNPRRTPPRTKSGRFRKRKKATRRRRRNPVAAPAVRRRRAAPRAAARAAPRATSNPRRRRRTRRAPARRYSRRRRTYRRNPSRRRGVLARFMPRGDFGMATGLVLGEVAGDLVVRGLNKFFPQPLAMLKTTLKMEDAQVLGVYRILLSTLGRPLFRMVGMRGQFAKWFHVANIFVGIENLIYPMRENMMRTMGLSGIDYDLMPDEQVMGLEDWVSTEDEGMGDWMSTEEDINQGTPLSMY